VQLEDGLFKEAKEQAAREGKSLKQLFEEGLLRMVLRHRREAAASGGARRLLPVSKASGGVLPGVDLSDNRALEEILERD